MINFAKLPINQRAPYFGEVANKHGFTQLIVEKDFWACFVLYRLFSIPEFKDNFVFKGGTSLSKVFGIIKRFSEDIDLTVNPNWLGFNEKNLPENASSVTKRKKCRKDLQNECTKRISKDVKSILEGDIVDKLGPPISGRNYLEYKFEEESKSPILIFCYPTKANDSEVFTLPQIRLEFGSHTGNAPKGIYPITPWAAEDFPDIFSKSKFNVISLCAERTFWEKATILHAEYHRPPEKPIRSKLSRDIYDLCLMARHESGKRAMADLDLLEKVVTHKQLYFYSNWASYNSAKAGTIHLVPPKHRLSDLKTDFRQMQEMYAETPPDFNELLKQLSEIEEAINTK